MVERSQEVLEEAYKNIREAVTHGATLSLTKVHLEQLREHSHIREFYLCLFGDDGIKYLARELVNEKAVKVEKLVWSSN